MNPKAHKFTLDYDPTTKQWYIQDDGVRYGGPYECRKDAQEMVDQIIGKAEKMSRRSAMKFFNTWKGGAADPDSLS